MSTPPRGAVAERRTAAARSADADTLELALQGLDVGILVVDGDGRARWCNERLAALVGGPADCEGLRAWLAARLPRVAVHPPASSEDRGDLVLAGGRTVGWTVRTVGDAAVWTFRDETDARRASVECAADAARIEDLYRHAPCGYHSIDTTGHLLDVNDTELGWLGYAHDEAVGQSLERFLDGDSVERFRRNLARFLADGHIEDMEYDLVRKDGTRMTVVINATAVRGPGGEIVASRSVMTDISARKRAEEALRASEERYRHLYEATPTMLHSIDAEGRLVAVSNFWLETLGYTREEVLGRPSAEFLTAESRARARAEVLPAYFRTGFCRDVPYQVVRRDGQVIDVLLSATAELDADRRVVRSLAVMNDVTDRVRAEAELARYRAHLESLVEARTEELAAANRELEAFGYSVSHDLRAPLRAIDGFSQALLEDHAASLSPAGQELLERVRAAARRQGHLIEDLFRLSRAGRGGMNLQTVDLAAIARTVAADLAGAHPERVVDVDIADLPPARADPELVRILLENLLGNAWKFTAGRAVAHVRVFADTTPGGVVYRVRDDGAGFDMALAGRLFTPFERLHAQREFAGTGLGLAIVARIAARHGGRAWAEGVVDGGATISFTLA